MILDDDELEMVSGGDWPRDDQPRVVESVRIVGNKCPNCGDSIQCIGGVNPEICPSCGEWLGTLVSDTPDPYEPTYRRLN